MTEQELFEVLKTKQDTLEMSEDKFSTFDCFNDKYVIELKCRNTHYDDLLIEKPKYDALLSDGRIPIYCCSTPKGIYLFHLANLDIEWNESYANPKTTFFNNNNRVKKTVGYINVSNSINIKG